jgi:hypothetical protein
MVGPFTSIIRRRAAVRCNERGATIFVVVLVITLLSGIGLFAARVTGSVDAATGYARQAAQAKGLALFATQMSAAVLANEYDRIRQEMLASANASTPSICVTNGYRARTPCALRRHQDLDRVSRTSLRKETTVLVPQSEDSSGSLGPRTNITSLSGVEGNLLVEYFDRVSAPRLAGFNQGSTSNTASHGFEYSATASAQIRPLIDAASVNWCTPDNESSSANVQAIRMYVVVSEM